MNSNITKQPVDYGVPLCGTIRFFTIPPGTTYDLWYMQRIVAYDRTLVEWIALINEWRTGFVYPNHETSLFVTPCNPFTTRLAASEFLTELLTREVRLRWIARKFIARIRERIYVRRIVGADCDLYTTLPIPEYAMVRVRDRASRSMYCFHVNTAYAFIKSALYYNQYGIAYSLTPKNPYTNTEWSISQLMVITSQICAYYYHTMHNTVPKIISDFRECNHNAAIYFQNHKEDLQIAGARAFFKEENNNDIKNIKEDLLFDLYDTIGFDLCTGWRTVKTFVLGQVFCPELQTRWDKLLCAVWIYQNYTMVVDYDSYDVMLDEFTNLHEESYNWWMCQPKTIVSSVDNMSEL
jgi:hypothetical protein